MVLLDRPIDTGMQQQFIIHLYLAKCNRKTNLPIEANAK